MTHPLYSNIDLLNGVCGSTKSKATEGEYSSCGSLQNASHYFYTSPDSHDVSFPDIDVVNSGNGNIHVDK